jgi:hypothetical protein
MAKDTFENKDELDAPTATDGLGNALIYVTTLILLIAFFVMEKAIAEKYDAGMLGSGQQTAPKAP